MNLSKKKCIPCEDKTMKPYSRTGAMNMMNEITGWDLAKNARKISRTILFKDFKALMKIVNKIADLAEAEQHHPDFSVQYNKLVIDLWTHSINGLSENDFIMAAKINKILPKNL